MSSPIFLKDVVSLFIKFLNSKKNQNQPTRRKKKTNPKIWNQPTKNLQIKQNHKTNKQKPPPKANSKPKHKQ